MLPVRDANMQSHVPSCRGRLRSACGGRDFRLAAIGKGRGSLKVQGTWAYNWLDHPIACRGQGRHLPSLFPSPYHITL